MQLPGPLLPGIEKRETERWPVLGVFGEGDLGTEMNTLVLGQLEISESAPSRELRGRRPRSVPATSPYGALVCVDGATPARGAVTPFRGRRR